MNSDLRHLTRMNVTNVHEPQRTIRAELEKSWDKSVVMVSSYYFGTHLGDLKRTKKILCKEPLECNFESLPLESTCSVVSEEC